MTEERERPVVPPDLQPYLPLIAETAAEARAQERRMLLPYLLVTAILGLLVGALLGSRMGPGSSPACPSLPPLESCSEADRGTAGTAFPTVTPEPLVVYVGGAVRQPHRVYTLPAGSLVLDAIQAAGGATAQADLKAIDLEQPLRPNQHLIVPTLPPTAATPSRININTASAAELEQLPGIGPTRARDIIAYRETHGPFATTEALQEVPGIGPVTYEKLAPYITVGEP